MRDKSIKIRRIRSLDPKRMSEIMLTTDPWKTLRFTKKNIRASAKLVPTRFVFGAFQGKNLIGFSISTKGFLGGAYLNTLAIDANFRGQGIGEALLKTSEKFIFKKYKNYYLCVSNFNPKAEKFYKNLGYKKVGVLKDFFVKGLHEHLYRKTKGPLG